MSGFVVDHPNAQRTATVKGRVRDVPRPNFVLWYHPSEWQLTVDGDITPSISHMSLAPGAGADETGNFQARASELRSRGYIEIPHDVMGAALPDYVQRAWNHRGKAVHRTVFQTPYNDATGNTKWRDDPIAIKAFVSFLRKRGIVERPRPETVEGMLHQQQIILDRLSTVRPVDNEVAHRNHERKLQNCERAISMLERELAESIDAYGQPSAPARSAVLQLLESELAPAEEAEEVARAIKKPSKRRQPSASLDPLPEPPGGGFSTEDGDIE